MRLAGMVTVDAVNAVTNHDAVALAALGLLATMLALLGFVIRNGSMVKTAAEQATAANRAVNDITPGEHRLYDRVSQIGAQVDRLVAAQDEFEAHGWGTLPPDLATAVGLTVTIRDLQRNVAGNSERLAEIHQILVDHVEWEMNAKYTEGT